MNVWQRDLSVTTTVPGYVFKLIIFNSFIWLGIISFGVGVASSVVDALVFFFFGALLFLIFLWVRQLLWRVEWWLYAIGSSLGIVAALAVAMGIISGNIQLTQFARSPFNSPYNSLSPQITLITVISIIALVVTVLYMQRQHRIWMATVSNDVPRRPAPQPVSSADGNPFDFDNLPPITPEQSERVTRRANDTMTPLDFQIEVGRLLLDNTPNVDVSYRENQMDIEVWKGNVMLGIVRCKIMGRNRIIAPLFIEETARLRDKLGLRVAYLASTGQFDERTQTLAKDLGIKLIDGREIKRLQQKSARR